MNSAFGVDHGQFSKGWSLNGIRAARKIGNVATAVEAPSKLATEGNTFTMARDTARMYGQSASRSMKTNPTQASLHQYMGKDAKRRSRLVLQQSNAYRAENTKRVLP